MTLPKTCALCWPPKLPNGPRMRSFAGLNVTLAGISKCSQDALQQLSAAAGPEGFLLIKEAGDTLAVQTTQVNNTRALGMFSIASFCFYLYRAPLAKTHANQ